MLSEQPPRLTGCVRQGDLFDAYLQVLAVYLSGRANLDPPDWTQPAVMLAVPWVRPPSVAIRNYLLLSSPGPFRTRNMFIDEDSLQVA
jgi:hypothetical protein